MDWALDIKGRLMHRREYGVEMEGIGCSSLTGTEGKSWLTGRPLLGCGGYVAGYGM